MPGAWTWQHQGGAAQGSPGGAAEDCCAQGVREHNFPSLMQHYREFHLKAASCRVSKMQHHAGLLPHSQSA
eukprot:1159036-Pelagomonas_calceolata.AAC.7